MEKCILEKLNRTVIDTKELPCWYVDDEFHSPQERGICISLPAKNEDVFISLKTIKNILKQKGVKL